MRKHLMFSQRGPVNIMGGYTFLKSAGNNSKRPVDYWVNLHLEIVYG